MTAAARKAAVTGHPVAHSRSPLIHGYWLKKFGINGEYGCLDIEPDDADRFFRTFSESGLTGANVTVPHKEIAAAACDRLDEAAKVMGAANTIWLDDAGRLCGANTDWTGFLGNLDQRAPGWDDDPGTAIVLGAGGAARAIVFALLSRKFKAVHIVNRTPEKVARIAEEFGSRTFAHSWDNLGTLLEEAGLVVNTTTLGMTGKPPLKIDLSPLPQSALVTDAVYVPLQTDLLKQAEQRGNRTVDGLGMLLHQAVPGFERWFGVRPEVDDDLRALIVRDLGGAK